jgi:poly(A) RNA polymerase GLD2
MKIKSPSIFESFLFYQIDQRKDAVVILSSVMRILESSKMVVSLQLILAKVPILRIKCAGVFSDIMVDLNVNNSVAVRNTHLMCYYSACKPLNHNL